MEAEGFLGLPLPVMVAFVALLFGLVLVARQLRKFHRPAVVRQGGVDAHCRRQAGRD